MSALKQLDACRKAFVLRLYDNTKDAVEVARRNYLESRLANGVQREMREMEERYNNLCKFEGGESLFTDTMISFDVLKTQVDEATKRLKERSDEFCRISSHRLPYKVEKLTYDELQRAQLPNYSPFLFDASVTFGPLSEKWETLKLGFIREVMEYFTNKPRPCLDRSSSHESGLTIPEEMDTLMEESDDDDDTSSSSSYSLASPHVKIEDQVSIDTLNEIEGKENADTFTEEVRVRNSVQQKPAPLPRQKRQSFQKTFSAAWNHIVVQSAGRNAENKRLSRVYDNSLQIPE